MARILLLILLVWILYAVIKRIIANSELRNSAANKSDHNEKSAEQIVQCSQCGLHVPESDSHIKNNLVTCNNPECNNTEPNRKQ
ncbi:MULTISPECIES: PP0621 family protein [Methylotenera]|uniref:PP0621 family protein n=1 Tax=Methylotenera TaxID=359407 RepID=UPI0004756A71|nr:MULTISPECIES: PP0621 family protein [Methylotenera]